MCSLLIIDKFSPVHGIITIPKNCYFIRGCDSNWKSPIIPGRPIYLTCHERVAISYAELYGKCGEVKWFTNSEPIKLYDIRYIKLLLLEYLSAPRKTKTTISNPKNFKRLAAWLKCAYGACSLYKQIKLLESIYKDNLASGKQSELYDAVHRMKLYHDTIEIDSNWNKNDLCECDPIEPLGIRLGETNMDSAMVQILSELFGHKIDGYIAPELCSPFQKSGKIHSEIVIFKPENHLKIVDSNSIPELRPENIEDIIRVKFPKLVVSTNEKVVELYTANGGVYNNTKCRRQKTLYDPMAYLYNATDEEFAKLKEEALIFDKIISEAVSDQYGGWRPMRISGPLPSFTDPIILPKPHKFLKDKPTKVYL